jgi:hypothetical protein
MGEVEKCCRILFQVPGRVKYLVKSFIVPYTRRIY